LKGDACFRLGKEAEAANNLNDTSSYGECACEHLEMGIAYTTDWNVAGDKAQWRENLCEALRLLQDTQSGAAATATTNRLLAAAQEFQAESPGNPAAVYFVCGARYALLQPKLLNPQNPAALCSELNEILGELDAAQAVGTRYKPNFDQLRGDLAREKQNLTGCQ
jgi:hypothetical protein